MNLKIEDMNRAMLLTIPNKSQEKQILNTDYKSFTLICKNYMGIGQDLYFAEPLDNKDNPAFFLK